MADRRQEIPVFREMNNRRPFIVLYDGPEDAVIRSNEKMSACFHSHEAPFAPNTRVHNGHMHSSFGKKGEGLMNKACRLNNGASSDLMAYVHNLCFWINGEDDTFHHRHVGIAEAEIRRQSNNARGVHGQFFRSFGIRSPALPRMLKSIQSKLLKKPRQVKEA